LPLQKNIGANFEAHVDVPAQLAVTVITDALSAAAAVRFVLNATELSSPVTTALEEKATWLPHPVNVFGVLPEQVTEAPAMVSVTGRNSSGTVPTLMVVELWSVEAAVPAVCGPGDKAIGGWVASTGP
jgi:hypothetical protein